MTAAAITTVTREGAPSGAPRPLRRAVSPCPLAACGYVAVREAFTAEDARMLAREAELRHWDRCHRGA